LRLNQSSLKELSPDVSLPSYDRQQLKSGIVHIGIGAFHRAHQAVYTNAVLNLQEPGWEGWGITGVSLRSATVKEQMAEQDGLYTVVERSGDGGRCELVGAVRKVLVAPEDPNAVVEAMVCETTKIVTITVTEKGYCHDPATGNLNFNHPQIKQDLDTPDKPSSCVGFIVRALEERKKRGLNSFTVLSCDNLPSSGDLTRNLVLQFAARLDIGLERWIADNTLFPNAMIDRIVPATTDDDKLALQERYGYRDEAMVVTEPFNQWVIEDRFCCGRPAWEKVGVLMVEEVAPYKEMKLRLLNGSHSLLAYLGFLAGYELVSECMKDDKLVTLCRMFLDFDAGETITAPEGFSLHEYKELLLRRFSNPGLQHRTRQIAMDGSQKIPQRILPPLREQLTKEDNFHIEIHCIVIAAWLRYCAAVDEAGNSYELSDPLAEKLERICSLKRKPQNIVNDMFSMSDIFGENILQSKKIVNCTSLWLERFFEFGVLESLKRYMPYI